MKVALVAGAGGFISSHMVKCLKARGYFVKAADLKEPKSFLSQADEFIIGDFRDPYLVNSYLLHG